MLFLYRDEVYNPDSQDRGTAEVARRQAPQRPGRQGPAGLARPLHEVRQHGEGRVTLTHPRGDDYQARFDALGVERRRRPRRGDLRAPRSNRRPARCSTPAAAPAGSPSSSPGGASTSSASTSPPTCSPPPAAARPSSTWVEADLATLDLGRTFDVVVLAGNVVLFVRAGHRGDVIGRCAAHVAPGGALVAGFQLGPGRYGARRLRRAPTPAGLAASPSATPPGTASRGSRAATTPSASTR